MSAWPAVSAYKARTHELVAHADSIVDIGCGPGVDAVALRVRGVPFCLGIESSATMAAAAAGRGAVVCRADAHHLPFPANTFAAARADRVVQHLARPVEALREMVRVVTIGSRIVIADPDQESLVIEVPGVRQSVLDRVKALRRDVGYRNGRLISRVPQLFVDLGVEDIDVEGFVLTITDPAAAFGLPRWPHVWRAVGAFTDDEIAEWDAAMASISTGFVYIVTFLVVSGIRAR
jgi:SAM-dependent methyltransferase